MRYNQFEQQLANTIGKHEMSLDINGLIDNIHHQDKKRRKIPFFIYPLVGIGLLFIVGLAYYFFNNDHIPSQPLAKKVLAPIEISKAKRAIQDIKLSENMVENTQQDQSQQGAKIENHSGSDKSGSDKNIIKNESKIGNSKPKANQIQTKNEVSNHQWKSNTTENSAKPMEEGMAMNPENPKTEHQEISRNNNDVAKISSVTFHHLDKKQPFFALNQKKIECPDFSIGKKWHFSIIPEVGLFAPIKKLRNKSSELESLYVLRDQKEKSLEGWTAALYLRANKQRSPFYFQAGLSYSKLNERMTLDYNYTKKDTIQGIISVTVSQSGDTITYIYGDIVQETAIKGHKSKVYSFTLLDIPLSVGYETPLGDWVAGAELGATINLSMSNKGSILASDTSFVDIKNTSNFKSNIGLSYVGSLSLGRDIGTIGRLYLAARYRYFPNSFSSNTNRTDQTYKFGGLYVGLMIPFK